MAAPFFQKWINENVADNPYSDPSLITDLADRAEGISREIDEEVHSLFVLMVEAVAC